MAIKTKTRICFPESLITFVWGVYNLVKEVWFPSVTQIDKQTNPTQYE